MNTRRKLSWQLALTVAVLASTAHALDVKLPPETANYKPSDLAGYRLVQRNCMTCHSAQYVEYQPTSSPRSYWEATVKKMKVPFGAPFPDADIPAMVDYLVKTYGSERTGSKPATAASVGTATAAAQKPPSASASQAAKPPDVQALLNANGCLACHAVDKKVLGPAFKEVASKYAGNADGPLQLTRSLRDGSEGKWGSIPMPPFSQLSAAELDTLVSWVLAR